jgi:predicted deacylase
MPDPIRSATRSASTVTLPSLERYRSSNIGIPYVVSFTASLPGPHVVLTAILHGNEVCGAIALDRLLRAGIRPNRGRLTFIFANSDAYQRVERGAAAPCRFIDEDMNRLWSPSLLNGERSSSELQRARALRPLIDSADYLLDIHSMQHGTPLLLSGPLEKGRRLALDLGFPALVVSDAGHAAGTRLRDYGGFGDPARPQNAVLVECGPHDSPKSAEVAVATASRFLSWLGIVQIDRLRMPEFGLTGPARLIEVTDAVTATSRRFRFTAAVSGLERIAKAGTVIARDGDRVIATPYDDCVLVMPADRCQPGQTAVRLGRVVA